MAKKIKPRVNPEIPYPGKRPEAIQVLDPEEMHLPEADPDIIIDPEPEEKPPYEPPIPGEGP